MEVIDYYYQILGVKYDASNKDIYESYNNKIKKYAFLPFLNESQKTEIKELKKAKFILSNLEYKKIYDSIIINELDERKKLKEKDTLGKKEKIDSQMINDRVFSMIGVLNVPQKNYDLDRKFTEK